MINFFLLCIFTVSLDFPVGRILSRGEFELGIRFQKKGGLIFSFNAAFLERFNIGVSYGGMGIVGELDMVGYPQPGVFLSFLLVEETGFVPAFVAGINTQGYDESEGGRYFVKSRGVYLCVTKEIPVFNGFLITGGINRTFETVDESNGLDLFGSVILNFIPEFSIYSEYSFGFNDPLHPNGILNIGTIFSFEDQFFFSFSIRDLLLRERLNRVFYVGYKGYL